LIPSRSAIASLLAAATLFAATTAAADPMADARRHFRLAERHYAAGRFEQALPEYQQAYELSQLPGFLFNIGACHHQLGHWAEAKESLQRYVDSVPDAPNRADAERLLEEATAHLPPPPPPEPVQPVTPEPTPTAEPTPVEPVDTSHGPSIRPASWILLGSGGALVIGAVLFAVDLGAAQSALDADSLDCTLSTARCHDLRDRGDRDAVAQLILGGAAAATLAAAGVFLALDLFAPAEDDADPSIAIAVGPGRLTLEGTW